MDLQKVKLINLFKNCLDILRDNEVITGDKALRNLSYLLTLKLIEPRLDNELDIDNYDYDFSHIDDSLDKVDYKNKLLEAVRFSNLSQKKEDRIFSSLQYVWRDILSVHPSTKNIFSKDRYFDIKKGSTFKKLIEKINSIDLTKTNYDVLGSAYEEVIKDIMTGKVLGQFFTQPIIKKIMIELINPQIHEDGKIDTCCDPTMGTGGFLITYLQYILKQAEEQNIIPDWNYIRSGALYGKEIESDTYRLALSNMLIQSGHMFDKIECGDSIRNPITTKFDYVLANPPFGIKGLKYDEFNYELKSKYIPIKSDNAVSLFIQAIIYMLKINGKCAIVLPDGQDLNSKTKTLISIREYLMKTCNLKEIIYLPEGIFTNTSIKTCIFYFEKKIEGDNVLERKEKGKNFIYKFIDEHKTKKIKFYKYILKDSKKKLLGKVSIDDIAKKSYSLNYTDYIKKEQIQYDKTITIKELGEICEIIKGIKRNSKDGKESGLYPLYYCSILGYLYLDTYDYEGEGIIINKTNGSGKSMVYYGFNKYNVGNTTLHFKSKTNNVFTKYIYYYLLNNISELEKYYKGSNQKSIDETDLLSIQIPIPSLELQNEIVKYLDYIFEQENEQLKQIQKLKDMINYRLNNQIKYGTNDIKTLDETCDIDYGTRIVKTNNIEGDYPVYGSGRAMFTTNKFNREGYNILIGRFALSQECVRIINEKIFLNDSGLSIKPKVDNLLHKYIGYYLFCNKDIIYNCARGTAQQNLEIDKFKSIQIHIPSLERQNEIVKYCDNYDILIKQIENIIEENKKVVKSYLDDILKSKEETKPDNKIEFREKSESDEQTEEDKPKSKSSKKSKKTKQID